MKKVIYVVMLMALLTGSCAYASLLDMYDQNYIEEVQRNSHTISHKEALINTINDILDCASENRLEVALIGWNDVPSSVLKAWNKLKIKAKEVCISRYSLALDSKQPDVKTLFYGFRAVLENDVVSESLIVVVPGVKKARVVATYKDGDPHGRFKELSRLLGDLEAIIEEGQVTKTVVNFSSTPKKIHNYWINKVGEIPADNKILVEEFELNSPAGIFYIWRLNDGRSEMLVYKNKVIYTILNGQVHT